MPPKRFPKTQAPGKKPPAVRPSPVPVASPTVPGPLSAAISEEMQEKFEEELAWCIHQLKNSLTSKKLGPKQEEEARKNLHVLENPQEAMVKKRCLMSKACGDYRQQMALEKRKVPLELKNAKISSGEPASTSHFMRKSHTADNSSSKFSFQLSDNSFRFNFDNVQK